MDIESLRTKVRPEQTALIIVDMQKDYCCKGGGFDRHGFDILPAQRLAIELNKFVTNS